MLIKNLPKMLVFKDEVCYDGKEQQYYNLRGIVFCNAMKTFSIIAATKFAVTH